MWREDIQRLILERAELERLEVEELTNKTGVGGEVGNENQTRINPSKRISSTFSPSQSQFFWEPLGYVMLYEVPGVSEANRSAFPCSVIVLNCKGMYVSFTEK